MFKHLNGTTVRENKQSKKEEKQSGRDFIAMFTINKEYAFRIYEELAYFNKKKTNITVE